MRSSLIFLVLPVLLLVSVGCNAQAPPAASAGEASKQAPLKAVPLQATPVAQKVGESPAAIGKAADSVKPPATSGKPAKKNFMALGKDSGRKMIPVGGKALDRAAESKRLIDSYQALAVRYAEDLTLATTKDAKETIRKREPSPQTARQFVRLLADLVLADPTDTPSLEALTFLARFNDVEETAATMDKVARETTGNDDAKFDTMGLLLEHHTNDPKIVAAIRRLPRGEATDAFLKNVFAKSFNPDVRWSSGAQLIASLRRNGHKAEMEQIVREIAEDRYLEGVVVGSVGGGSNARKWAINKLRELNELSIGNVVPDVSGEKLDGSVGKIEDYRGKVVVIDVWSTYCVPCIRMIPHQTDMVKRLKDKPFALLSASCDTDKAALEAFLEKTPMPWDHWWVGKQGELVEKLNISAFPTILIVDGKGVIRHKGLRGQELEDAVDALLAEQEK